MRTDTHASSSRPHSPASISSTHRSRQPTETPVTPENFLDPVSFEPMADPVFCNDGYTYDRAIAEKMTTSPFTRQPFQIMGPNVQLRSAIWDMFPAFAATSKPRSTPALPPPELSAQSTHRLERRESDPQQQLPGIFSLRQMQPIDPADDGPGALFRGTRTDHRAGYAPGITLRREDRGVFDRQGRLQGLGQRFIDEPRIEIRGHFRDGIEYGSMLVRFLNESRLMVYEGESDSNWVNDNLRYGFWSPKILHGKGVFKVQRAEASEKVLTFAGTFSRGVFEGATFVAIGTEESYRGHFSNNRAHGFGVYLLRDGRFTGLFQRGLAQGFGRLEWESGLIFEGRIADGLATGGGTLTFANGASWAGEFVEGRPSGMGLYTNAAGVARAERTVNDQGKWLSLLQVSREAQPLVSIPPVPHFYLHLVSNSEG